MTTRKFLNNVFRRVSLSERIETSPGLPPEDAALALNLLALAESMQPEPAFVARLERDLAQQGRRPHSLNIAPAPTNGPDGRLRLALKTTWGWLLPAAAVLLLILIISLLVQLRPGKHVPAGPAPGITETSSGQTPTLAEGQTPGSAPTASPEGQTPGAVPTPPGTVYIVMPGDTLASISEWFNVPPEAILQANHLSSPDAIYPNQRLVIPASPTITPTPAPVSANQTTYIVQDGDILLGIAAYFGVTPEAILEVNHMNSYDPLFVGQSLIIPPSTLPTRTPTTQYIVQEGDTLLGISSFFGVTVDELLAANHLESFDTLRVGQTLIIPPQSGTETARRPYPNMTPTTTSDGNGPLQIAPTPVPAGVFPLLFYPPAQLTYDTSAWVDRTEYDNPAETINYLQARSLYSCQLGSVRMFGYNPTSALTVTLGNIQYSLEYQETSLADSSAATTTAYYMDTGSLAGYPYAEMRATMQGAIILTVTANSDQWEACKALAETVLSTLQLADSATTPPPATFALIPDPPLFLNYDPVLWNATVSDLTADLTYNYLQARDLDTCQLGSLGPSDFNPSPDQSVILGAITYQVTLYTNLSPGMTVAFYVDTSSLAGYPYAQNGAITLNVTATTEQWDVCRSLAETVLATLHLGPKTGVTSQEQALLNALKYLVARRRATLLSGHGWIYRQTHRTEAICGSPLPSGGYGPCEIDEHAWYELNDQGQVVTILNRSFDRAGNVYGETVTQDGLTRYLTLGYQILAPLTTTYPTDQGFVERLLAVLSQGESFTLQQDAVSGTYILQVAGEGRQEATFDLQTGALQALLTRAPEPFGQEIRDSVTIVAEQRVDQPPADVLALLDQPLQYQPLPSQGDPLPAGFDLAHSTLSFQSINGDDFNYPSFFYGDIRADILYLVGRVDFGALPGGECQRSPDGLRLAFNHVTLSDGSVKSSQLRWLDLGAASDVHNGPADLQLASAPAWAPDNTRLAFMACDASQSCGLYAYDTQSGVVQRLTDDGNANPPVWSPDGTEIAYQAGEEKLTVVVTAVNGVVDPSPTWQPYFPADWRGIGYSQCEQAPPLAPALPAAPSDWRTYANAEYGFTFRYPANWTLSESPHTVLLGLGDIQFEIDFSRVEENHIGGCAPGPEASYAYGGHLSFYDQALPRYPLVSQDRVKGVCYGAGSGNERGDLRFTLSLRVYNGDYANVDLSTALQQVVDRVVESFAWFPGP